MFGKRRASLLGVGLLVAVLGTVVVWAAEKPASAREQRERYTKAHKDGNFKVAYDGPSKRTVTDGPFAEAKEVIAGYWIIETRTREEAVEWAKRAPMQEGELEVRQIFSPEEFAEIAAETAAKESALWSQVEKRG